MPKKEVLEPYGKADNGHGCRNCLYREHPKDRIESICACHGIRLNVHDVFACTCPCWKQGKAA